MCVNVCRGLSTRQELYLSSRREQETHGRMYVPHARTAQSANNRKPNILSLVQAIERAVDFFLISFMLLGIGGYLKIQMVSSVRVRYFVFAKRKG